MRVTVTLNFLTLISLALAIPKNGSKFLQRRQASNCNCPSDVSTTSTALVTVTVTSSTAMTTNAGTIDVTGDESTDTVTVTSTTTVQANSVASTTTTIGGATITTTGAATTITSTTTISSTTITTCIPTAYKHKRQAVDSSTTVTSAPTSTTITTNFGGANMQPATCVCRLVSAYGFPTTSSTSPATTSSSSSCSCSPVQTTIFTITSTVTQTSTTTSMISQFETSTDYPETTATVYSDITITTTSTTTFTVSKARVTSTNRSTVTATTTVTPTYVSCPTANLSCNNAGIRWAIYPNTNAAGANNTNTDKTYSTFDPTVFKNRQPEYQNITYTIGGFDYPSATPVYISFYNSTRTFESDYIALNHVGYVFAQVNGTYTFSISKSDDITLLWVGANAYSGYTRANANIVNPYGAGTSTYQVNFVAGNYYPFRIIFGNAQQAIVFQASLTAPDGTVILTSNSKRSPYLVQYSCDGSAPAFPAFGSET